jgi:hypothetical protein
MTIQLDHLLVPVRNRKAAAEQLAAILGVAWAENGVGPFSPVYVSDSLTLDFDESDAPYPVQHYCFRVGEAEFDAVLARLQHMQIPWRSTPHGAVDMKVNTDYGGRIVYWSAPDLHVWEMLTQSYERDPRVPTHHRNK